MKPIDYIDFKLECGYIVGYGMDYREEFRNLLFIYSLDCSGIVGKVPAGVVCSD